MATTATFTSKEGLVALFTAYEATASDTALASWTPANYYGIKGYEDYIDPSTYTASLVAANDMNWKWGNGALVSSFATTRTGKPAAYFNLASLYALMRKTASGSTFSVQEVYQIYDSNAKKEEPIITQNADGKWIIENYTSVTGSNETSTPTYGHFTAKVRFQHSYLGTNENVVHNVFLQIANNSSAPNIFFNTAHYTPYSTARTYYYNKVNDDGTTTLTKIGADIFVGSVPLAVMEQTVSRQDGDAVTAADGTVTIPATHTMQWQFAPSKIGNSTKEGRDWSSVTSLSEANAAKTTFRILYGKTANNYSVRMYNTVLTEADCNVNHLADLCGFYGTSVDELLTLSDLEIDFVASKVADVELCRNKYTYEYDSNDIKRSVGISDEYTAAKTAFETILVSAVKVAKAAFKTPDTYELLYVKDGLVALFDAHSSVKEMGTVTSWMPVNLYGKAGYDSYLAPASYALSGAWTAKDGAYRSASGAYFSLSSLLSALAEETEEAYPTYTVQEVFNFAGAPNGTDAVYTKDEAGDTIISNYTDAGHERKDLYSTYGSFKIGYLFYPKTHTPSGVTFIHNYLLQLQTHNGSSFTYYRNFNTNTDYYATKGVYYYMADGVKTALNSGKATYAGTYPSAVWEQTAWRLLDISATDEENIVFDGKVSWQFRPGTINAGSYSGRGFQFTTSYAASLSLNYNALTILNAGNINVYSVRVYNKTFTEAEMNRNHLADLCAFYEVDVTALLEMSEEKLGILAAEMADVALYKEKGTDGYKSAKLAFETELAAAIGATLTDGTTTYIDLYVKEGLVALFDAHSATASDEAATEWTPVDLYGKEGYDAYLEPVAYPLYDNTSHLAWKWENGRLISYRQSAGGKANDATNFYFNLDSLGAKVGKTYTVQEVFQITDFNIPRVAPTVEIDADGSYIITNYTSFNGKSNETSATYYGPLQYNTLGYHKYSESNDPVISAHFGQIIYYNASNTKKTSNTFFNTSYYFTDPTRRKFYYMKDVTTTDETTGESVTVPTKTLITTVKDTKYAASLGDLSWAVTEQSVARLGAGTLDESTGYTKLSYRFTWQFMPSKYGNTGATARTKGYATYIGGALSETSRLRVLGAKIQNAFSVRVYNVDLAPISIDQNHFADLCGFYGIKANGIGLLSDTAFAKLVEDHAAFAMVKDAFDENGAYTDSYYTQKLILQTAVNDAVLEELYSVEAAQRELMAFEGHSFRLSGDYGIRAIISLDKDNLARVEDQGITLLNYGAIMAIGSYNGTTYNESAEALTVTADADGIVTLAEGIKGAALTSAADTGFKTLSDDETKTTFAYTTTYPVTSAAEVFSIDMLYRAFAVFEDAQGNVSVTYYDMTDSQALKNSLFNLHKSIIDYYGHRYTATIGMDVYDYIYDVLSTVDGETYSDTARAAAKEIAAEYGFDADNIVFSFGALSDVHVVNAARGNRMANMMKVFSNTYGVDAILFAGDITDKLNGSSYATDAGFLAGYKELAFFAEYAAAGNVNNLPLIWTLGNHERPHMTNTNAVTFTSGKNGVTYTIPAGTTVTDGFYSVMENSTSTFMDPTEGAPTGFRRQDVGGYAFFAVDYTFANNETIKWLDAQLTALEAAEPNKPIFVTSHMPTNHSAQIDCINECIEKHHNVIYFSGHTHVPMQSFNSITERDGFLEIILGPGSHGNFGVSGSGSTYNSYEMKQGALIEVDTNGNVRVKCVDMNYDVKEDGSIETLFTKGGTNDLGTIATNPFVLRTAYFSNPSREDGMHVSYDSVPRTMEDPRYEAPAFETGDTVGISDVSLTSIKLSIPKALATNFIKYYKITATDAEGKTVTLYDPLAKKTVSALNIGSEHTFYVPYDIGYPDPFVYTLKTSYTASDATKYVFEAGASYTVHVTAYDDFGTATETLSGTFTVPAE